MTLIEASITAGIRPTSMILHTQPGKKWDEFDFLCLEAHQMVVDERCPQCGYPKWMCHDESGDIGFKPVLDTCFAVREVESHEADTMGKMSDKKKRGVKVRPEVFTYSGKPLDGDMREAYYRAEWLKANPED